MSINVIELELTGRCPLRCAHCYAESGPTGSQGTMTTEEWKDVIDQAAAFGVRRIQLIGGEPTTHKAFASLLRHAVDTGLAVEVFSSLFNVRPAWWELFALPGVSLATSYYSDRGAEHDAVTGRVGSHVRTRASIAEAVRRGIPIRAGIIDLGNGQRAEQARAELVELGVTNVRIDRMRGVGRGARGAPDVSQLCGRCGRNKAAISPDGDVWPCVLSRWMRAGNVRETPLAEIIDGPVWKRLLSKIPPRNVCVPECGPSQHDGSDCAPAETEACNPAYCTPDVKSR